MSPDIIAAWVRVQGAELHTREAKGRAGSIIAERAALAGTVEELVAEHERAEGLAILKGKPAPAAGREKRRQAIADAQAREGALKAAAPLARAELVEAEAMLQTAREALGAMALPVLQARRQVALTKARDALSGIVPALATFQAADALQDRLCGPRVIVRTIPEGLFAAKPIVAKLISGIPARLKPEGLTVEAVTVQAERIAADTIRALKESANV